MLPGIPDGRGVWGKMDTCTGMTELLHLLLKPSQCRLPVQFSLSDQVVGEMLPRRCLQSVAGLRTTACMVHGTCSSGTVTVVWDLGLRLGKMRFESLLCYLPVEYPLLI